MDKVAERTGRSTATIMRHIKEHSVAVERAMFCPACRRVKSDLEGKKAQRGGV